MGRWGRQTTVHLHVACGRVWRRCVRRQRVGRRRPDESASGRGASYGGARGGGALDGGESGGGSTVRVQRATVSERRRRRRWQRRRWRTRRTLARRLKSPSPACTSKRRTQRSARVWRAGREGEGARCSRGGSTHPRASRSSRRWARRPGSMGSRTPSTADSVGGRDTGLKPHACATVTVKLIPAPLPQLGAGKRHGLLQTAGGSMPSKTCLEPFTEGIGRDVLRVRACVLNPQRTPSRNAARK